MGSFTHTNRLCPVCPWPHRVQWLIDTWPVCPILHDKNGTSWQCSWCFTVKQCCCQDMRRKQKLGTVRDDRLIDIGVENETKAFFCEHHSREWSDWFGRPFLAICLRHCTVEPINMRRYTMVLWPVDSKSDYIRSYSSPQIHQFPDFRIIPVEWTEKDWKRNVCFTSGSRGDDRRLVIELKSF